VILDTSAVLAAILGEPGAEVVTAALPEARISAVNLGELVAALVARGMPEQEVRVAVESLGTTIEPFDEGMAWTAGLLRAGTPHGLGLGDRACLATALHRGEPALTADRLWASLDLTGVEVRLLR
jgi:ribonuclease VapC